MISKMQFKKGLSYIKTYHPSNAGFRSFYFDIFVAREHLFVSYDNDMDPRIRYIQHYPEVTEFLYIYVICKANGKTTIMNQNQNIYRLKAK